VPTVQRNEHKLSAHDENNLPTYKTNPPLRENPPEDWIECPTCDGYHPADYWRCLNFGWKN
jgi:hypothetical protein